MTKLDAKRKKEVLTLAAVFLGVLVASALAVYLITGRSTPEDRTAPSVVDTRRAEVDPTPVPARPADRGILEQIFVPGTDVRATGESWGEVIATTALRLLLAALLGAALALRPRRQLLALKRNPFVSQTQILLAVVASALMMIVGDNAARAFGIFAAVSLVRFRTNIRDPKEITVLLISLAIGLSTGVGRWDLALVLTVFALLLLWILEYREPQEVFRTMNLNLNTRDVAATLEALRRVFEDHEFDSELRRLTREGEDQAAGTIAYSVNFSPTITTDEVTEEILGRDPSNVVSIEWDQKKSFSYLYQ